MKAFKYLLFIPVLALVMSGCKKTTTEPAKPKLIFKFKFDPTQDRYDSFGNLQNTLPANHRGQSPTFNAMSAHYIELTKDALVQVGAGAVLYHAPEVTTGGATAIDFSQSTFAKDGEAFYEMNLKDVAPGDYQYLRVSLAYQNYDVVMTTNVLGMSMDFPATVASFIGFKSYVSNYTIKNKSVAVNANKAQGYWGFESRINMTGYDSTFVYTGQAAGTTVVNPIASTSAIPPGSCLVTGSFNGSKLRITGNETKDVVVTVSLSTNKSFEWVELNSNNKWEPQSGENIVDMGVRGMIPSVQY